MTVADLLPTLKLGSKMLRTGHPRLGRVGEHKCGSETIGTGATDADNYERTIPGLA